MASDLEAVRGSHPAFTMNVNPPALHFHSPYCIFLRLLPAAHEQDGVEGLPHYLDIIDACGLERRQVIGNGYRLEVRVVNWGPFNDRVEPQSSHLKPALPGKPT
jgi:hypothetical protein